VKAAESRDAYEDVEEARTQRRDEYQPIAQFDHTYQTTGIREGISSQPTYTEAAASPSSQPRSAANQSSDAPPSYSAIVKGGIAFL
jgi:hypothetical protein